MFRIAIYGKGGIGKSTTAAALSCAFAEKGLRVLQVGCDPKADSTLYLHDGKRIPTILETLRKKRTQAELEDLVFEGCKGIMCAESGGPIPGLGCAGRGIAAAFEALDERNAFDILKPDVVLYDVLGDVVCGGFAMPIREGYAEQVYIVTSGENMAIYAAANIAMAVANFKERGYASLGGVILNRRDVPDEREKVETLCRDIESEIVADLPRDNMIAEAEKTGQPLMEAFPDSAFAKEIRRLADYILEHAPQSSDERGILYASADMEGNGLQTGVICDGSFKGFSIHKRP
ncbi:MAG: AAA family ATPase [Schwartzia sp.]|nr:AAA family ATPase [Schwartzia sp. (in: firmicutes)]